MAKFLFLRYVAKEIRLKYIVTYNKKKKYPGPIGCLCQYIEIWDGSIAQNSSPHTVLGHNLGL